MEEEDLPSSSEDEDENELETTEVNRNPSFSAYQNRGSHASSTSSIKNHPSTNEEIVEDEEITSEEDEEVDGNENEHDLPSSSVTETHLETSDTELADEKRVRLAKAYLNELKQKQEQKNLEDFDAADIDRDLIAERLNEDALESKGVLFRALASYFQCSSSSSSSTVDIKKFPKGHSRALTCVVGCTLHRWIYTGSKDGSIIQWNMDTCTKNRTLVSTSKSSTNTTTSSSLPAHSKTVTCMVVSGTYLISGSEDGTVKQWDQGTGTLVHTFKGHRGSVTSLAVALDEPIVYSGSMDKTIKAWHLQTLSYIETLFGHEEGITCLHPGLGRSGTLSEMQHRLDLNDIAHDGKRSPPSFFSTGGRDGTVRGWQVQNQSHMVFRPPPTRLGQGGGSLDTVFCIDADWFVSGNDLGVLGLWHVSKKNPVTMVQAHQGWIIKVTGIPHSDLVVSGGVDGQVHLWQLSTTNLGLQHRHHDSMARHPTSASGSRMGWKGLQRIRSIPMVGCINDIFIFPHPTPPTRLTGPSSSTPATHLKTEALANPLQLLVAVAHEHKAGRWWCIKDAPSGLHKCVIYPSNTTQLETVKHQS